MGEGGRVGGEGLDGEVSQVQAELAEGRGCAWAGWIAGRGLEGGSSAPRTWQGAMAQGPTDVPMCASARLVRVRCSPLQCMSAYAGRRLCMLCQAHYSRCQVGFGVTGGASIDPLKRVKTTARDHHRPSAHTLNLLAYDALLQREATETGPRLYVQRHITTHPNPTDSWPDLICIPRPS